MLYTVRNTSFTYLEGLLQIKLEGTYEFNCVSEDDLVNRVQCALYNSYQTLTRTPLGFFRYQLDLGYFYITYKPTQLINICEFCGEPAQIHFPVEVCEKHRYTEEIRQLFAERLETEVGIAPFNFDFNFSMYVDGTFDPEQHQLIIQNIRSFSEQVNLTSVLAILKQIEKIPFHTVTSGFVGILLYQCALRLFGLIVSNQLYLTEAATSMQLLSEMSQPLPALDYEFGPTN